jgi:hypothetical protein
MAFSRTGIPWQELWRQFKFHEFLGETGVMRYKTEILSSAGQSHLDFLSANLRHFFQKDWHKFVQINGF